MASGRHPAVTLSLNETDHRRRTRLEATPDGYGPRTIAVVSTHVQRPSFSAYRLRLDSHWIGKTSAGSHIYSLMTDRCVFGDHGAVLQQLEIEYIRSRGDFRECRPEIIAELDHLKTWTSNFLADRGVTARLGSTSKYTFLRSLTTSTPGPKLRHPGNPAQPTQCSPRPNPTSAATAGPGPQAAEAWSDSITPPG
jgi:hypothetical protein